MVDQLSWVRAPRKHSGRSGFGSDILHKTKPRLSRGFAGFVYIIYSEKWDQYYLGSAQDVSVRLEQHNSGKNKSTKGGAPWTLKYTEEFEDLRQARQREAQIKKKKSRKFLEWLISSAG